MIRLQRGFSAIELLIVMVIVSVLASIAVPSFTSMLNRGRVKGAGSDLYTDLQYARSEAVQRNAIVRVGFTTSSTAWCYVIYTGNAGGCTCGSSASTCTAPSTALKNVASTTYTGVSMATSSGLSIVIEPRQAALDTTGSPGTVTLTSSDNQVMQDEINLLGRVRLCSPSSSVPGYPAC